MLIGIDPLLGPELLAHLRSMGHGDELVIADANFPAASVARRLVRAEGATVPQMLAAVLALLPLDTFVDSSVCVMEVVGSAALCAPITEEFRGIVAARAGPRFAKIAGMERFAFYERARQAYAVVATGERRTYGNIILRKGILEP
ncbi:MAG: RbsD/FucU family protein [Steroidobacteraceae bacterium]